MESYTPQVRPIVALLTTLCTIYVTYGLGLAIYRLWLSPISSFPGPKLAALTKWYEFYYEVVQNGRFTFHIQELHKKYGKRTLRPADNANVNNDKQVLLFASHPKNFISKIPDTINSSMPYLAAWTRISGCLGDLGRRKRSL